MFIGVSDIRNVCDKLAEAIAAGNTWMAYQSGSFINGRSDIKFFNSEAEAEDFCIANYSDYDNYVGRKIRPLYDALSEKNKPDVAQEDIEYYFVNGNNEVNTTLKVNPNQNPLHNSEGNAFTDALFDHWEKQHLGPSVDDLKNSIPAKAQSGIDDIPPDLLENNYPIPRNILDAFDVAGLMKKMADADWYYDYTEDHAVWHRGNTQINEINTDLLQLSKMENGVMAANYLWDAYVPIYSVNRPDFLRQELQNNYSTFKNITMNQDNLDYLKNSLLYMGFGDRLHSDLEKNIRSGKQEFTLHDTQEFYNGNRKMESALYYNRGKENEMYFWNKYDGKLIKADGSSESQTFYINQVKVENKELEKMETKLSGYTLKEAANLLDGRAVEKEFYSQQNVPYSAWKQLDFSVKDKHSNYEYKTFHENYGYDVTSALERVPVKDLERNSAKEDLIRSLKKGNLQAATAENGERVYLAANPQFKSINVFDKDMKPVRDLNKLEALENKSQGTAKSKETSLNGNTQEVNAGGDTKTTSKVDQVKNNNIAGSDDLLQKTDKKKVRGRSKGQSAKANSDDDLISKKRHSNSTGKHL